MDHDQNFKNLIIDYPKQALQLFAQSEAQYYDQAVNITPVRQQQLKDMLGGRYRELDVPLLVEWPNGEREALLFVLEEESVSRHFSIHRLAHYCLDLAQMFATNRVVPVVIFLGTASQDKHLILAGDKGTYLTFHYLYTALAQVPWQQYKNSDNLVACLNLPNMQYQPDERIDVHAKAFQGLMRLEPDIGKQTKYLDFIDIYSNLSDNELQRYQEKYPKEVNEMSGFSQRFKQQGLEEGRQEGRQQGMQQGMQEGMQQGEAAMLLLLVETKFGTPTEQTKNRIAAADSQTLLQWSKRIIAARSLNDIWH